VRSVGYDVSNSQVAGAPEWGVARGVTIFHILDYIEELDYHRFTNSTERSGCLYWCRTVVNALSHRRWITPTALAEADYHVNQLRYNADYSIPVDEGGEFWGPN
jgi:hypothetical protein